MTKAPESDYRLYVIMRTSLASMSRGRIAAQACHAGSQFNSYMDARDRNLLLAHDEVTRDLMLNYRRWKGNDRFGTTIVLDGSDLKLTKSAIKDLVGIHQDPFFSDSIFDCSYPIKDGGEVIYARVETCLYLFCSRKDYDKFGIRSGTRLLG